jgi:hypothetical protein
VWELKERSKVWKCQQVRMGRGGVSGFPFLFRLECPSTITSSARDEQDKKRTKIKSRKKKKKKNKN